MIPLEHILGFSAALFGLGILGICLQQNFLRILLSIEAMLNGAALGFIGTAVHFGQVEGHVMFLVILAVAAAEVSIGLCVLLHYDQMFKTLDISYIARPKE